MKAKLFILTSLLILLTACGSGKKNFSMNVLSDPLGAYALMQITYKENENADWIFLGPTPIDIQKQVQWDAAQTVSLKVLKDGFYEQVKTWKAKDFLKEHKANNGITWVPNLVQQ